MNTYILFAGASGIGLETAKLLKSSGNNVVITSRSQEKLDSVNEDKIVKNICDLSEESIEQIISNTVSTFEKIDGVANFCGSILLKPLHLTSLNEFQTVIDINLKSSFLILKSAVKSMMNQSGGSIVLMSSAAAQIGLANHEAIAAAKGALIAMAKSAATTYAAKNIRVNCVAPGLTRTELTSRITNNEAGLKASITKHPLGRIGEAAEVAQAVNFLLSSENSWITGQVLGVDGGLGNLK
jgi:3-oxoacyl-[acyl-carrier protein] reductase